MVRRRTGQRRAILMPAATQVAFDDELAFHVDTTANITR